MYKAGMIHQNLVYNFKQGSSSKNKNEIIKYLKSAKGNIKSLRKNPPGKTYSIEDGGQEVLINPDMITPSNLGIAETKIDNMLAGHYEKTQRNGIYSNVVRAVYDIICDLGENQQGYDLLKLKGIYAKQILFLTFDAHIEFVLNNWSSETANIALHNLQKYGEQIFYEDSMLTKLKPLFFGKKIRLVASVLERDLIGHEPNIKKLEKEFPALFG